MQDWEQQADTFIYIYINIQHDREIGNTESHPARLALSALSVTSKRTS